jgi:hypothetical protein
VYFYEIHEGDTDLFSDALLAHELEFDEEEFLRLVLEARERVLGTFEEDTLVEAIANELERRQSFIHVDDARLTAAVNVSEREGETFLADVAAEDEGAVEDDDEASGLDEAGFRSLLVSMDRNVDLEFEADEGDERADELPD